MPYLRMFLGEKQIDEVFISDVFVESVLGNHFIEEEKQIMIDRHSIAIKTATNNPHFDFHPPREVN